MWDTEDSCLHGPQVSESEDVLPADQYALEPVMTKDVGAPAVSTWAVEFR